jgi:TNF receptor-associated factor 4
MKIKCDNADNGCEWIGKLRALEEHMVACDYTFLSCPNECDGGDKILRKDIEKHKMDECPRRQYVLELQIREQRKALLELQETVKKQENMSAQLQSIIIAQSKEINELKVEVAAQNSDETSSSDDSTQDLIYRNTFKFTKYAEHKSNNDHVYSPPFYSGPGGYKLCIEVHANGSGSGKGTHLSVYAYLMRGDNDDHLPWPFTGTVKVKLLNQRKDGCHHSKSIRFGKSDSGSASSKRIKDGDRAITGPGQPKYILQSSLGYQSLYGQQYLKNDCLYFRMTVTRCRSTPKPWLFTANVF